MGVGGIRTKYTETETLSTLTGTEPALADFQLHHPLHMDQGCILMLGQESCVMMGVHLCSGVQRGQDRTPASLDQACSNFPSLNS